MPAKWHLPGREADEDKATLPQERLDMSHKALLEGRLYVLYHVVHQYKVIAFGLALRRHGLKEVLTQKSSPYVAGCEILPGLLYPPFADVNPRHLASCFGKGQQVATLAAADLKYAYLRAGGDVLTQVVKIVLT